MPLPTTGGVVVAPPVIVLRDDVVKLVETVPGRLGESVGIRKRRGALLDQRLNVLGEEPLGLLPALPHVEDPEHAGVVVEPRRVGDQPVERTVADLVCHEVVILRRAIGDRELLDVDNCHNILPSGFARNQRFPQVAQLGKKRRRP